MNTQIVVRIPCMRIGI